MSSLSLDDVDIFTYEGHVYGRLLKVDVLLAGRKCHSLLDFGSMASTRATADNLEIGSYRTPKGEGFGGQGSFISWVVLPLKIGIKEMKRPGLVVRKIVPPDVDLLLGLDTFERLALPSGLVLIDLLKRTIKFDEDVVIPLIASLSVVMPGKYRLTLLFSKYVFSGFLDNGGAEEELDALSSVIADEEESNVVYTNVLTIADVSTAAATSFPTSIKNKVLKLAFQYAGKGIGDLLKALKELLDETVGTEDHSSLRKMQDARYEELSDRIGNLTYMLTQFMKQGEKPDVKQGKQKRIAINMLSVADHDSTIPLRKMTEEFEKVTKALEVNHKQEMLEFTCALQNALNGRQLAKLIAVGIGTFDTSNKRFQGGSDEMDLSAGMDESNGSYNELQVHHSMAQMAMIMMFLASLSYTVSDLEWREKTAAVSSCDKQFVEQFLKFRLNLVEEEADCPAIDASGVVLVVAFHCSEFVNTMIGDFVIGNRNFTNLLLVTNDLRKENDGLTQLDEIAAKILLEDVEYAGVSDQALYWFIDMPIFPLSTSFCFSLFFKTESMESKLMDYTLKQLRTKNWAMEDTIKLMQRAMQEMRRAMQEMRDSIKQLQLQLDAKGQENTLGQ
uniref:Uncharacterized protein n=1 Tax=Ditylenchus dipsaci TaxID=166011 RepID=A0A915DXB2_9BILA